MPPNGNKLEYACFISYRHPPRNAPEDHFYKQFVRALKERLEGYLTTELRTFIDEDADPGTSYPSELSKKVCKSVCMIAVLTPDYPDSKWCKAEWEAMEKFENKRLGPGQHRLIIPVVLRGDVKQWESFYERKPIDLRVVVPTKQLGGIKNSEKVQKLAAIVESLVQQVKDPCEHCDGFQLVVGIDDMKSPPTFPDSSPFGG